MRKLLTVINEKATGCMDSHRGREIIQTLHQCLILEGILGDLHR